MLANALEGHYCPIFLFAANLRQGWLYNPATAQVVLEFPQQRQNGPRYELVEASEFSPAFAEYLRYLVTQHLLFSTYRLEELACVDAVEEYYGSQELEPDVFCDPPDPRFGEISMVWLRVPIHLSGLPAYYDSIGFCFLDDALYSSMYCDVLEIQQSPISVQDATTRIDHAANTND